MKAFIRLPLPYFLILFTTISVLYFISSAVAQSLPVVKGTYGSPPGQGLSPSQSALEAAKREKQEAEQQLRTAQSALEQANAARLAAEEQIASAQTALETATAAEQAALAANAEQLQVAEQAQTAAEQQLASAQTTLDSANTKLQEAKTSVADANEAKRLAEQALAKAVNEVKKIKGLPVVAALDQAIPSGTSAETTPVNTSDSVELAKYSSCDNFAQEIGITGLTGTRSPLFGVTNATFVSDEYFTNGALVEVGLPNEPDYKKHQFDDATGFCVVLARGKPFLRRPGCAKTNIEGGCQFQNNFGWLADGAKSLNSSFTPDMFAAINEIKDILKKNGKNLEKFPSNPEYDSTVAISLVGGVVK